MRPVNHGVYRIQEGDTPTSVSNKLYGSVHRVSWILDANSGEWTHGDTVIVPNFKGVVVQAGQDEQFPSLYRRVFGTAHTEAALAEFVKWNGSSSVEAGDDVFLIDYKPVSYGY